jgi:hypothetical protein
MADSYRIHVHDHNDQGRWLASADFGRRPQHDEINAALPVLREPGRYEVRVNPVDRDGDEHSGWAWVQDAAPERVIFRKFLGSWTNGEIIALFPDLPDGRPGMVLSYMHAGQHGAASMGLIGGEPRTTRPAKPEEYAALKAELEHLSPQPYRLAVLQRTPRTANQPRNIQARKRES